MSLDDNIRDLASHHGHDDLSDSQVQEVRRTLSEAYVDDILDGSHEIDLGESTNSSTDGDLS